MRKKVKNPLTQQQQKILMRIIVLLVVIATLWLVFAPNMGILSLHRQNRELQQLVEERKRLELENEALRLEVERIQKDIEHFEKLAREKHGLLKKNEILFDFSKKSNDSK